MSKRSKKVGDCSGIRSSIPSKMTPGNLLAVGLAVLERLEVEVAAGGVGALQALVQGQVVVGARARRLQTRYENARML